MAGETMDKETELRIMQVMVDSDAEVVKLCQEQIEESMTEVRKRCGERIDKILHANKSAISQMRSVIPAF
jgi:hypothetical protein